MGVIISVKRTTKTSEQLRNGGIYTIPKPVVLKNEGEYDCLKTSDSPSRTLCGKRGCTDSSAANYDAAAKINDGSCSSPTPPAPPPTTGPTTPPTPPSTGTTGGGITINPAAETALERMYHKLNLHVNAKDPALDKEFKDLRKELRGRSNNGMYMSKMLRVQWEPNPDNAPERIVMWGRDTLDRNKIFSDGEWGWINDEVDPNGEWTAFEVYNPNLNENMGLLNILKEKDESLPEMIDHKLKEFNFYTASDKGKQVIVFNDENREEISHLFDDLIKKYPEDVAFVRSVVLSMGMDKKTEKPVVRLGSYYNNSEIELPFNGDMNGLGKLLDSGIVYFTVVNTDGPDLRDFKLVAGDQVPEFDFTEKDKEEIQLDNYKNSHEEEMSEIDEPFEEAMKKKEQSGLHSLLDGQGLTNELTKRQKEILENLKKKGFKFDLPENSDIYERVKINSKEFNESIKAWRPKK
jgi:hypothetical protein